MTDNKDMTLYSVCLSTCTTSAEEVAKILVKKPDVEKQIANLIKVARYLDVSAKEAERYSRHLTTTIKQKEDYTEKLLLKIATLYMDSTQSNRHLPQT